MSKTGFPHPRHIRMRTDTRLQHHGNSGYSFPTLAQTARTHLTALLGVAEKHRVQSGDRSANGGA